MSNGELFIINHAPEMRLMMSSTASLLNLKLNLEENINLAWANSKSQNKILMHFLESATLDIKDLDESLFATGMHIAICNKLSTDEEILLLGLGFRAALLSSEPAHTLLRQVTAMLNGNLCFSNEALSKYILNHHRPSRSKAKIALMTTTTKKEKEVMSLVCNGLSNEQVADRLNVSINTIKMHMQNIYKKTNIKSRGQLLLTHGQNVTHA